MTMKAILAATFAATILTATPAVAERFVITGWQVEKGTMSAADLDTIRSVGGYKRMWEMTALALVDPKNPGYVQSLTEFDCVGQRSRMIAANAYNEKGEVLTAVPPTPWQYPAPRTGYYHSMEYACGKTADEADIKHMSASEIFVVFMATFRDRLQ